MTRYVRVCKGLTDSGKLVPEDDYMNHIDTTDGKDYYKSLFFYTDKHVATFKETGTVSGITDVVTDTLVFDFDSANDIGQAKSDAIELCSRLAGYGVKADQINVCFSGNKGFTVELNTVHSFTPSVVKQVCKNLGAGLTTLDTQIYNASRIFRVPFTKHQKSNLYKLPLTIDNLSNLSVEEIMALAGTGETSVEAQITGTELPTAILELKDKQDEVVVNMSAEQLGDLTDLDFSKRPKGMSECRYALLHGFFKPGQRNKALMILAAHYRAQGLPKEITYRILKGARELNERRYPSSADSDTLDKSYVWNNIIEVVYGPNWKGAVYTCKDEPVLAELCKAIGSTKCGILRKEPIVSIGEVSGLFKNYATNIDKNTIKTGIKPIDAQIRLQSNSHVVIAGCSGAGKTTLVLSVLNNISNAGSMALFGSMDMSSPLVYQKLAHKVTGLDDKSLYNLYKTNSPKIKDIDSAISEQFKNVLFDFRSGVDFDDLRTNLLQLKEKHGDKLKLAVYDYINRIRGPYSDETANLAYIAPKLADLANETDTLIISLAQIARAKGGPATPLLDSRIAKGSSSIEESASVLFGIWRNGYNTDFDKFITVAALKTRMGKEFKVPLYWNGLTGEVRELTPDEAFELEQLESTKEESPTKYD